MILSYSSGVLGVLVSVWGGGAGRPACTTPPPQQQFKQQQQQQQPHHSVGLTWSNGTTCRRDVNFE